MTPFATVGVDVGTSTTKVVLGNGAGDMEAMRYVPLNGACRWPSVVTVHTLRGDIHVFNEHDSTFSPAKVRRNLKLAILLSPEHPELRVVEDHTGWRPDTLYCAMVTFALAKALHEHGPCDGYSCFVGAPLRDVANDGRRLKFGQIGYAARNWSDHRTDPLMTLFWLNPTPPLAEQRSRHTHSTVQTASSIWALEPLTLAGLPAVMEAH